MITLLIPFIAGQWSLLSRLRNAVANDPAFQSPSLRGSGRFRRRVGGAPRRHARFNPLHCGAVVASRSSPTRMGSSPVCFNPLHCGAVVASDRHARGQCQVRRLFQSPSLRGSGRFKAKKSISGFKLRGFNPLHCGAVVASRRRRWPPPRSPHVSIPFIAGQWSLPPRRPAPGDVAVGVSIPFIAGQWSLLMGMIDAITPVAESQSPSLRGSGRFGVFDLLEHYFIHTSQSPSLRGSGRFT